MNYAEIESCFSTTSFNPEPFIEITLHDHKIREKLIHNVIDGKKHINYYFNSYLIIKEASPINPALFYPYWDDFWKLHTHKNSYYRMIAHDLITNLSVCDTQNKFQAIKSEYLDLPRKEKISNFLKMSHNLLKANQPIALSDELNLLLTDPKVLAKFTEKQRKRIEKLAQTIPRKSTKT